MHKIITKAKNHNNQDIYNISRWSCSQTLDSTEKLPKFKHSSLFRISVSEGEKKFLNIDASLKKMQYHFARNIEYFRKQFLPMIIYTVV